MSYIFYRSLLLVPVLVWVCGHLWYIDNISCVEDKPLLRPVSACGFCCLGFIPKTPPSPFSTKTKLASYTNYCSFLCGLPVVLDLVLFKRLHHHRFYLKTAYKKNCCDFLSLFRHIPVWVLIRKLNKDRFHPKVSAWKTNNFRILYLFLFVTVLSPTIRFVDCCWYYVHVNDLWAVQYDQIIRWWGSNIGQWLIQP